MIRFSRYTLVYFLLSACILVPGIYSLVRYGLKPSIDFTGGSVVELVMSTPIDASTVETLGKAHDIIFTTVTVQDKTLNVEMKPVSELSVDAFLGDVSQSAGGIDVIKRDSVGPVIGKELLTKAVVAALLAIVGILLYMAYAFKNITFGFAAVIALFHDILVVFSVFSLLGHFFGVEVDTLFVTAFLTTMSFSVHDTIVIFDRIREYRRKDTRSSLADISDIALTETMGRSLVNSFTIIFMLLALVLLGGSTIQWFAVALLVGTITGTYSSPFIATPVLLFLDQWKNKRKQK